MVFDAIGMVETSYNLSLGMKGWMESLAEQLRPLIGGELGMISCRYQYRPDRPIQIKEVVSSDVARWRLELMLAGTRLLPKALGRRMFVQGEALTTPAESFGPTLDGIYKALPRGFREACPDAVLLKTFDTSGEGIVFSSGHTSSVTLRRVDKDKLARVAAHLAAGLRLRLSPTCVDAVYDPASDKLIHTNKLGLDARARLRAAAQKVDKARLRTTSEEDALGMWEGLVDGTWSLVESFESDGRRLIIAKRNPGNLLDPRALSPKQRQVAALAATGRSDKLVAYTLGLSVSSVRTHLDRAMRKLGVRQRRELLRFIRFRALPAHQESSASDCTLSARNDDLQVSSLHIGESELKVMGVSSTLPRQLAAKLTTAEIAVAERVLQGMSNTQISEARNRTIRTIANQIASIYKKLEVSSRGELIALACPWPESDRE